jgi:hypothetical protein
MSRKREKRIETKKNAYGRKSRKKGNPFWGSRRIPSTNETSQASLSFLTPHVE